MLEGGAACEQFVTPPFYSQFNAMVQQAARNKRQLVILPSYEQGLLGQLGSLKQHQHTRLGQGDEGDMTALRESYQLGKKEKILLQTETKEELYKRQKFIAKAYIL